MNILSIQNLVIGGILSFSWLLSTSMTWAAPIAIQNPSFENDVLASGAQLRSVSIDPVNGIDSWGLANDLWLHYIVASSGFTDPTAPDGNNAAFSNKDTFSQVLSAVLLPNMIYTLQVEVGEWAGNGFAPNPAMQLRNGVTDALLYQESVDTDPGIWTTNTLIFETDNTTTGLGDPIKIAFTHGHPGGSAFLGQVWWDDIRLDASPSNPAPIPEPSTMLLFGTGLLATAIYVWRRERTHQS